MVLGEIGWEGVGWIHLAQYRDQWWALETHSKESLSSIKGWEFLD